MRRFANSPAARYGLGAGALLLAALLLWLLTSYKLVRVHGASMEPSLQDGQLLLIRRDSSELQLGDVLVFEKDQQIYIKRVVALPGDCVVESWEPEYLAVNGQVLLGDSEPAEDCSSTLIPAGHYFVLGDNHANSIDSRSFEVGLVLQTEILGVVCGGA